MADRKVHNFFCKMLLGKDFDEVNEFLDSPVKVTGPRHRHIFHDEDTIIRLSVLDIEVGMATMLHKILDEDKGLEEALKSMIMVERV